MKIKNFIMFVAMLLIGCTNKTSIANDSSSATLDTTSDIVESSEALSESNADICTSEHHLTFEDIEDTQQSQYLEDTDFIADDISYHGVMIQRGKGSQAETIQMKKGSSYIYLKTKIKAEVSLTLLDKGDYTGIPTIYFGDVENSRDNKINKHRVESLSDIKYTFEVDGYLTIADEDSFALYLKELVISCHE